jgi:phosphatidylglycerol:prolipoprotein diacylglycerol transferase
MLPFLRIGPLAIPTYGVCMALACFAGMFLLHRTLRRANAVFFESAGVPVLLVTAGIAGARIYHLLQFIPVRFMLSPAVLLGRSGFAWYGGVFAALGTMALLARYYRLPLLSVLDTLSPAAAIAYGIGRLGCLLAGDGCYGVPTKLPWGMQFPNGLVPTSEYVHPTPIYEFIAAVVTFLVLWRFCKRNARTPGRVFSLYLILSGLLRFCVEFIRRNPKTVLGLTNAQAASLGCILLGFLVFSLSGHVYGRISLLCRICLRTLV